MELHLDLSRELQEMHRMGIVISPWLSGVGTTRLDPALFEKLEYEVSDYVLRQWTPAERLRVFGNMPSNDRLAQTGIYEIVTSTAVYLAHEKTGDLDVAEETVNEALSLVQRFTQERGFSTLILLYLLVTSWENMQALAYYGEIPEQEFLLGEWHRPWIDYSIWDELLYSCYLGTTRIVVRDGQRMVQLTDEGYRTLAKGTDILERAGYFSWRLQTLRISQFSQFDDYPALAAEIWPDSMEKRRIFLDWAGIQPGMKVLELGCADGVFTFDGGLAQRVGPTGYVVGLDPSSGMLARANHRLKGLNYDWVEFRQGRAEELPFPDGTFDAVIGVAFLHFTDRLKALREMRRVVRPGGIVASLHPLKFTEFPVFFREWFAPLFDLATKRNEPPKDYLPFEEEILKEFQIAGLRNIMTERTNVTNLYHDPDKIVRHFIEGVGWFGEELSRLPWRARMDLIEALKQRGREVCNKYPREERVIITPGQMIKGYVPSTGEYE